jgi:carbonic anhydrase
VSEREDLLAANAAYAEQFSLGNLTSRPIRRLAVVTCMDVRLDPAAFLGLSPGDAHVIRNAGAVVSDDVLRSLIVSNALMGAQEALVIGHTGCGMQRYTDDEIRAQVADHAKADAGGVDFLAFRDVEESVRAGVRRIEESPLLPAPFAAFGFVYDTQTGALQPVDRRPARNASSAS